MNNIVSYKGHRFTLITLCQWVLIILTAGMLMSSCQKKSETIEKEHNDEKGRKTTLFSRVAPEVTGIDFINAITENEKVNLVDYFYLYDGGGVSIGDINNDGLSDVFFTGNQVSSRLYLNLGGFKFEDITQISGVETSGWCSGVTMVDINQDGLLDIYICRAGNELPENRANLLFINKGTGDSGKPYFEESAKKYGLAFEGYSTQAAFFDYDKDGDLDMYLLTHTNDIRAPNNIVPITKDGNGPANDHLFRNDGPNNNPVFKDITKQAGILFNGLGLGVSISDLNGDGWDDVYVSNDFIANDQLYINNKNGTFSDMSADYIKHQSHSAMGNDLADFNNDGLIDIMVADMLPTNDEQFKKMAGPMRYEQFELSLDLGYMPQYIRNTLQLNNGLNANGKVTFSEIGQMAGVFSTDWSWAPLLADFDNDGWKDLFISNGYRRDVTDLDFVMYNSSLGSMRDQELADDFIREKAKQMPGIKKPDFIFRNKGDLTFEDVSARWGISFSSYANGAAYGDLDNDGDLDLVINTIDEPPLVYRNSASESLSHHFINVRLKGSGMNKNGIGAVIKVYHDYNKQLFHHSVTKGYQSSMDYGIHIGLGNSTVIDSLIVTWPDGKSQTLFNMEVDRTIELEQSMAIQMNNIEPPTPLPIFTELIQSPKTQYFHLEDEYNDFSRQFLLPHKHSRMGPGIAIGDMNGDKTDDFFVGGAFKQPGMLFFQLSNGTFKPEPLDKQVKYEENMGSLLFDADLDGDLDLYVSSGSNEFAELSTYYQDKLYMNDGKGNFLFKPNALPKMESSSSCVISADYDLDGDLDLFIGGRLSPMKYPMPGVSYLLENTGGVFQDVTKEMAPELQNIGMVSSALWTDFNNDNQVDLIVVGEFMPITCFINEKGRLKKVTEEIGLSATNGWWNSINGGDFDNDGDIDYVLGNLGSNNKFKATIEKPVSVYAADIDNNGTIDPILTYFDASGENLMAFRDNMLNQIVSLRKKFPGYSDYANAGLFEIFSGTTLGEAYVLKATSLESSYMENMGNGRFQVKKLPVEAQVSPIFGTLCKDFDNDGNLDILMVGNSYSTEVIAGRYDASVGLLLKGDGKGNFQSIPHKASGFFVDGDAKGLAILSGNNQENIIIATQNNGPLKLFRDNVVTNLKTLIKIQPLDFRLEISFEDGNSRIQELYYGASYLSQISRVIAVPENSKTISVHDFSGKKRVVYSK